MGCEDSPRGGKLQQLVVDTSVLRDLHCAEILAQLFRLGCELLTTNLIERKGELEPLKPDMLKKLGLKVEDLPGDAVRELERLRTRHVGPGIADLSALVLARRNGCKLVTRDRSLTEACRIEGVAVRDTKWLLGKMVVAGLLSESDAADALEIINNTRVKPPNPDWTTQIKRWRKRPS